MYVSTTQPYVFSEVYLAAKGSLQRYAGFAKNCFRNDMKDVLEKRKTPVRNIG